MRALASLQRVWIFESISLKRIFWFRMVLVPCGWRTLDECTTLQSSVWCSRVEHLRWVCLCVSYSWGCRLRCAWVGTEPTAADQITRKFYRNSYLHANLSLWPITSSWRQYVKCVQLWVWIQEPSGILYSVSLLRSRHKSLESIEDICDSIPS